MFWKCGKFTFDSRIPTMMGILNITPDSFSDGGEHFGVEQAISHAHKMIEDGAKIIDIGGESTRPGAEPVSIVEEKSRILQVIDELSKEDICISVDTRHAEVADEAVRKGASIINDVSGFTDPNMVSVAKNSDCGLVVMHMRGTPQTMTQLTDYDDVVAEVYDFLKCQVNMLENSGIDHSRICIDLGPGFAKTTEQTRDVLRNIQVFRHMGYPVLSAPSRKRHLPEPKDEATAEEVLRTAELGASIFRVHNVEMCAEKLKDLRPYVILSLGCNLALIEPLQAKNREDFAKQLMESKVAQLNMAMQEIIAIPETEIVDISSFYVSEPAYFTDQDEFVNCALVARTALPPIELLQYIHVIENALGRVRDIENGPRTCDIDIVDYQMYLSDRQELTLPHPLCKERDFVVEPVEEIMPNHILADDTPLNSIARELRVGQSHKI